LLVGLFEANPLPQAETGQEKLNYLGRFRGRFAHFPARPQSPARSMTQVFY
jgi:hypothetical protein